MAGKQRKFNVLEHELVPKCEVLPLEEALKVVKELGISPQRLPWIRASDPMAQALNAKPGDIIKITRKSPLGTEVVTYRFVITG